MPVHEKLPTRSFELYTRTTEKMWTHQGTVEAANALSACEMWLYKVSNGSKTEAVYNVALILSVKAKVPPSWLTEIALNERSVYLYSGSACLRLPRHLRRFVRKPKK
mgnify:CR=1 FL=1